MSSLIELEMDTMNQSPFTPEQLARERRMILLIAIALFFAIFVAFGVLVAVFEGRNISSRIVDQLHQGEPV